MFTWNRKMNVFFWREATPTAMAYLRGDGKIHPYPNGHGNRIYI